MGHAALHRPPAPAPAGTRVVAAALAGALALGLAACAATEFHPARTAPPYPPYAGEVRVLDRLPQSGTYRHLGVVIATGVKYTGDAALRSQLVSEAAQRGADAIVLQGETQVSRGGRERKLAAWAIRVEP